MTRTVIEVKNLKKDFEVSQSFMNKMMRKPKLYVKAVDNISFKIKEKESFALVGESGCGKTTVGKILMRLINVTSGEVYVKGKNISKLNDPYKLKVYRRMTQMIYQDPFSSLDPRFKVYDILEEPLLIHNIGSSIAERRALIEEALENVRLTPPDEFIDRYPHMLSGGQRQRVAIARCLILNPDVIVADEPVSMLDVSVRAELLNLMKDLIEKQDLTYLYITHDVSTTRFFAKHIGVMYLGDIVEQGPVGNVLDNPLHPYTQALLTAIPEPEPERLDRIKEIPIRGDIPAGTNIPEGCRFHPRCPYAKRVCIEEVPDYKIPAERGHIVRCHFAGEIEYKFRVKVISDEGEVVKEEVIDAGEESDTAS